MNMFQSWGSYVSSTAQPVLSVVRAKWLRALVYACAAALVLWFYGSYFRIGQWSPLASDRTRLLAVGAVFVAWLVYLIWYLIVGRRRNRQLIGALTEGGIAAGAASAIEVEQVRQRLQQALAQLRRLMGGRRGFLYELPWYLMIGPPGSGKTTALTNSGLKFPLAASVGRDPLRGVGGTRNCEWWITEHAILLDTAGRYTTQDSDPENDRGAWQGFLRLLRQYRPLQPINGVIVTLSVEALAAASATERLQHAEAVRARIFELNQAFTARFPIYVLFTKADLIAGFVEFFDALNRADREQVWGVTFPLDTGRADAAAPQQSFESEFDLLIGRLNALSLERLQQEVDLQRRGLVFGFPSQMTSLKEPLAEFLGEVFTTSRFDRRPLLRGVYFASGTQTGVPIDRVMQAMSATFQMPVARPAGFSGAVKTYFLKNLLEKVIFAEASLASVNLRLQKRRRLARRLALAVAVLLLAGTGSVWAYAYWTNQEMVATLDRRLTESQTAVAKVPGNPVNDADFAQIVPPLNGIEQGFDVLRAPARASVPMLGLEQDDKLRGEYADEYQRALDHLLLPRVLVDLQNRMRERPDDADFQFEALKVYLSLGNQGPLDVPFALQWMRAEWEVLYPAPDQAGLRGDLNRHFAALLGKPLPTVTLDATLIGNARKLVAQRPLAQRTYALIRDSAAARALPDWIPLDKTGAVGTRTFYRLTNKPLTEGIPGFYTRRGYFDVLLPQMNEATDLARRERWVYGPNAPVGESNDSLAPQIVTLYKNDFDTRWRSFLADVRVVPFHTLDGGVQVLNALSGPESTLRKLVASVGDDTDLAPPKSDTKDEREQLILKLVKQYRGEQAGMDETFEPIRDTVRQQTGQLNDTIRTLDTLYTQLSKAEDQSNLSSTALRSENGVTDAVQNLVSGARRLPPPIDQWMLLLAANVTQISSGTAKTQLTQLWGQAGARFCQQAVTDRYPFTRNSKVDVSLDDFDKLFAPGGVLDKFFQQNLQPFVNASTHPWQWQYQGTKPVNSSALAEFERAETIREAFYNPNSSRLSVEFDITPNTLDNGSTGVLLDLAGQKLTYDHGPARDMIVRWPSGVSLESRLAFQPGAPNTTLTMGGPWSLFRLFEAATIEPLGRDTSTANFTLGGHAAQFTVRSSSVLNPFRLPELREFRCPDVL